MKLTPESVDGGMSDKRTNRLGTRELMLLIL